MKKLALAFSFILGCITTSFAQMSSVKPNLGFYHQQFNGFRVTALLDRVNYTNPNLFKNISQEEKTKILTKYSILDKKGIPTSVNAFLIDDGGNLILIDSGTGTCYGSNVVAVAKNIELAGYKLSDVKTILLTHFHPDHICGITQNNKALFPNATVYTHEKEADFWLNHKTEQTIPADKKEGFLSTVKMIKASLEPYEKKQAFKTFKDGETIQGVEAINSKGHTPGHHSFLFNKDGQSIIFIGDITHSHSLQFDAPKTSIEYDVDQEQAIATRLKMFDELSKNNQLIAASHLPFPAIGYIYKVNDEQYQWIPIYYDNNLNK